MTFLLRWNQTGVSVLGTANSPGSTSNRLDFPLGIAFDSSDTLYIADSRNNRIQRLFLGNNNANTVAGNPNGIAGSNGSLLIYPNDVVADDKGNIYVVDTSNARIQLWYANASSGITIAGNGNLTEKVIFLS